MKDTKILVATLIAGLVLQQAALCQTNANDASPANAGTAVTNPVAGNDANGTMTGNAGAPSTAASNSPAMAEGGSAAVASVAATNPAAGSDANGTMAGNAGAPSGTTAVASGSNAPSALAGSNEMASGMSMSNAAPGLVAGNATAEAGSTNSPAAKGTNAPAAAAELPIHFENVPITTAIESLARLAGINYLLDPKIGYGQPGPNGQPNVEPVLSVRWEKVTAQQALLALLDNYSLQLLEDPKTGIAKITPKAPNALPPLVTRVVQLQYASTSNMQASVTSLLLSDDPRSRVVPDARTSQLVIVGTERGQAQVDTLMKQLDKPTRQVLIETKLVELSSNPSTTKGVDWSGTLQAQNVTFGNGVLSGTSRTTTPGAPVATPAVTTPSGAVITPAGTSTPGSSTVNSLISTIGNGGIGMSTASGFLPDTGFLTADGAKAVLSFLNQSTEAQVVSTPRVVTLDNETATISVTTTFPIVNVTAGTANTTGGSTITYSNIGTILQVTPRITANDYIWLKVIPDVSSFAGQQTITSGGQTFTPDTFESRHIETQVLIPNANTLVMGGLVQDNPNAKYTKVPFLGDIPGLGWAFRSETKSMQKDNLLIFITPTIVQNTDFKPTTTDFLKSEPQTMKDSMDPRSSRDGAQPRGDWSNPIPDQAGTSQNTSGANAVFAK